MSRSVECRDYVWPVVVFVVKLKRLSFLQHATDINECEQDNKCHVNASCTNIPGSYNCVCNARFTGDGYSCTGKKVFSEYMM